ncbi:putative methylated-DNA--protein-cysteine methyltransferase [Marinomonas sp. MED121]|uniref:methylated-DNA--[protein]-cysteine S-methyltransferase n=1 Tax=Marinomonas sp. MED121 TaxID=314277 RepID=UPI000068FEAC|nr:methylated-DNA--[protein]-cysteine S-methyltransferase [Marinomonas sp. MED121]EAQ66793.1 putative methylated-DNA--protein-cysteine methyltransferase [Marinomonas sp. MED121]
MPQPNSPILIQYYKTNYAEFILGAYEGELCMLDYRYRKSRDAVDARLQRLLKADYVEIADTSTQVPVFEQTKVQLEAYFLGERKTFDLPLLLVGSEFQQGVWRALLDVPYGETASYLELSKRLNNEKAIRAVASANGANAISIIVPCHRIIGSKGELVGYAGGLPLKKRLLDLEQARFVQETLF